MIFSYGVQCIGLSGILILILTFFAFIAYQINANREDDDSKKMDFSPLSPWITPLTPFLWIGRMIILAPWSIVFGIFLVLFPFILIVFRPLPPDTAFNRFILKVGKGILKINTQFLRLLGLHPRPIQFSA